MLGSSNATERAVAGQLLGKNAAQIQTLLGSGKTDAANAAIAHAFPNQQMLGDALHEAVLNLVAKQKIEQQRTQVLQPYIQKGDITGYNSAKNEFNMAADPRIFQYLAMPHGAPETQEYLQQILKQDPSLKAKAAILASKFGVQ
jgi:hypothetical protein